MAPRTTSPSPKWYHWALAPLSGAVLANAVPHFVNGISGNEFPTPFATPPTVGMSTPVTNVIWGVGNAAAGYALLRFVVSRTGRAALTPAIVLAGALAFSVFLSSTVSKQLPPLTRSPQPDRN